MTGNTDLVQGGHLCRFIHIHHGDLWLFFESWFWAPSRKTNVFIEERGVLTVCTCFQIQRKVVVCGDGASGMYPCLTLLPDSSARARS